MKSQLLLVTLDFPPRLGGVARYLHALALYFKKEITVWAESEKHQEIFDQNQFFLIKRFSLLFSFIWPHWLKTVLFLIWKKNNYDQVIISHILPLGTAALLAQFFTGKPYWIILHGMDISLAETNFLKKKITKLILKKAKVIITNSQALNNEIKEKYSVQKIKTIYPPLSVPPIINHQKKEDNQDFNLLTVSRLIERKGHTRVLQALSLLKKRKQLNNFKYRIVGTGNNLKKLQSLVKELKLVNEVIFEGYIDDQELSQLYTQADIFIMPTVKDLVDREGFGMVYIEAGFYQLPSIATNQDGVNEAVIDQETGYLVKDGDIEALAQTILRSKNNSKERIAMGKRAYERALNKFTPEKQFSQLNIFL